MTHEVVTRVDGIASYLRDNADKAEVEGRLPDETAQQLRDLGVIRMLQPKDFGGYEAHPCDFFEAVMAVAANCGSAGWVSGIVGVHPWELALMDRSLQEEVWGDDPDTWIASPYSPSGVARPVDGGYVLSGRWPFSSGTDHCDWAFLGAALGDADGKAVNPMVTLHVVLPRSDYSIVEGSWEVAGLKGTGSKDVVVENAFIPSYRVLDAADLIDQTTARNSGRWDTPLYRMPWSAVFPVAISSAVIGACEGVLREHLKYQERRISPLIGPLADDSFGLHTIGAAAADIAASRLQLLNVAKSAYDVVSSGGTVTIDQRTAGRRDQVRSVWRAVEAVDKVVSLSGGSALRLDNPLQRLWRDTRMGLQHAIHVSNGLFQYSAARMLGLDPDVFIKVTI